MIVILTKDLMMSSSANSIARADAKTLKAVVSLDAMLNLIAVEAVSLLLIDLQLPGLKIEDVATALETVDAARRPKIVAYAQHVNVDLLSAAKRAGFDDVQTRGALNRGLAGLLGEFS